MVSSVLGPSGEAEFNDDATPGALIGGRYRVLRSLGRGGMASVYEAIDEATSRQIALKRLHSGRAGDPHASRLFELEFYTLAQLSHPRIVAVHDYQRTPEAAFYTMELLNGGDLGEQQVLPWKAVCALLCDVCSALSLLHSRRLVHRDVTPRNIRLTRDGKAKLIDFGAMARFGTHARTVGTPPFTPPEAIHAQPIDGRADLYAVGATAYYALTGRHAYPARTLVNLRNAWRSQPALPSRYAADIPPDLDQLVMALLSLAPSGRPASAGAVIERLTAIAGLQLEEQQQVQRAFLSTPSLVGRDAALRTIRRHILRAAHGRGSTLFLTGPRGVGRSRMIDACVLEAKLASAFVLRADVVQNRTGEFAGARALLDQLAIELAGQAEPLLRPHAAALGPLWPSTLGAPPDAIAPDQPAARPLVQQTLLTVLLEVSREKFVVIACDDVDAIDEPTRALIALLAEHACRRRLVVVVAAESESAAGDMGGASLLRDAERIALAPLSLADSERLLISMFGDVPNVRMLASRLHEVSAGLPAETMQLAQHLLDHDLIRFCEGRWLLPTSVERDALPPNASAALRARFAQLDERARMLGQAIALSGKHVVTLDDCGKLLSEADWPQLLACLDTLVTAQVLQVAGDGYVLNQRRWASLLLAELDAPTTTLLHARVADMFEQQPDGAFRAAAHRLAAGDLPSAIDLLVALVTRKWEPKEHPARLGQYARSLPAGWRDTLEAAAAAAERLGRPQRECFALRQLMLRCLSAGTDFRPDVARAVIEPLRRDSGLLDYEALGDSTPSEQRLTQALQQAQARYDATPAAERGLPPAEAIRTLVATITQIIGMSGAAADFGFLSSMPSLAPLTSLSPAIAAVQRNLESTCHLFAGRYEQAREGYVAILESMANSTDTATAALLPVRKYMELAVTYAVAGVETMCGLPEVGERLDVLERDPMFEVNAWQLRTVLALRRGDEQAAAVCERKCERLRIRNAPVQFFDGADAWYHVVAYAEIGDVARVRQCLERIEPMAARFRGWSVTPSYARGQLMLLRGDAEAAAEVFAQALQRRPDGQFLSWAPIARGYLTALAECGRVQEARERGALLLEQARSNGLTVQIVNLHFGMASVELHGGDHEAALEHVRVIDRIRGRWPLGRVFAGTTAELRARIALAQRDRDGFRVAARACDAAFVSSGHPILIGRYQRLLQEAERVGILSSAERGAALADNESETTTMTGTNPERAKRLRALVACENPEQRLDRVLSFMLGRDAGAAHAMLYLMRDGEPQLSAQRGVCPDPERMQALIAEFARGELEDASQGVIDPDDVLTSTIDEHDWIGPSGARFMPTLLSHATDAGAVVTGVLVLAIDSERHADDVLLSDLSAALVEAGDVTEAARAPSEATP
jgi:tetratricopeptide (TPR) repeat protein